MIGDDLLRLIFTACHPVLSTDARIALTLKLLGGLTTQEIARAFLVPEPTIAQRIVRAKRTLGEARCRSRCRAATRCAERLASVLEVVYLVFNEGYTATRGEDWMRPALMRRCAAAGPHAGRAGARRQRGPRAGGADGTAGVARRGPRRRAGRPVLLIDQDRARWDRLLIRRGLAALDRARALAVAAGPLGPYALQAAIAACHARAASADDTDWPSIVALYDALVQAIPSPVVELNRAVAVGMAFGPEAALEIVDALLADGALRNYQWLPSVRGDLLAKLGRHDEACAEFERAAALAANARERELLLERARAGETAPPAEAAQRHPGPAGAEGAWRGPTARGGAQHAARIPASL